MNSIKLDQVDIFPSKVICIGRNYVEHIEELGNEMPDELVIFMKPNSAISQEIITHEIDPIHYESEITFSIKSGGLSGVGFGLDLTKRKIQSKLKAKGLPWERAKSFDNSAVFSDFVTFNGNFNDLRMELYINNKLTQLANCELMINKPDAILRESSGFLTLVDGDLIMTGTPKGVGILYIGDEFTGKIIEKENLIIEHSWTVK
jgi:2-keto-4-pentenoate hydratase/2-oxohepta-3-ene-1,7-dioic acid hydratase in catechol pathway